MIAANVALLLVLAFTYGYLNGLHGSASIAATMISSRAVAPRTALMLAALGIFLGPMILGVAVATTIGKELVSPTATTTHVVMAALLGAIFWSGLTLWLKIPTSISQALIGGLIGAVWAGFGSSYVLLPGILKVTAALFLSPILGVIIGFGLVRLCYRLGSSATPRLNIWLNRGQVCISMLLAIAFGANDGQKIIGMTTLGLVAIGVLDSFVIPFWVVLFSTLAITLGTLMGGWRLIHTLGDKFYKVRPVHGFGAQMASTAVIFSAGILGGPVSGSHVVTSAIVGAGSADRVHKVRWGVVQQILTSWMLTLPASALMAAVVYSVMGLTL